ncbi:MAG: hypothetical protein ACJ72C_04580 [Nitrososphaeraceae archaeon]
MECELPGKPLVNELGIDNNESVNNNNFIYSGRLNLNRKKTETMNTRINKYNK